MENQVRELNSLILFSIISSLRGFRTYIGTHYSILKLIKEKKNFGGILIHKGSLTEESCKIVKNKCDKLAILDQEISPGYNNYWYDFVVNARIIKNTLQYVDKYYCINDQVKKIAVNSFQKKK